MNPIISQNLFLLKNSTQFLILSLCLGLTACSAQRFDCPYKEGVRCLPLSEVDKRITSNTLHPKPKKLSSLFKSSKSKTLEPLTLPPSPMMSQAEILTVWIAPYQTKDGCYHEEKRLHFVAKEPQWLNTVDEIKEEDEAL